MQFYLGMLIVQRPVVKTLSFTHSSRRNLQPKLADRASKIALANHTLFELSLLSDFKSDFLFWSTFVANDVGGNTQLFSFHLEHTSLLVVYNFIMSGAHPT